METVTYVYSCCKKNLLNKVKEKTVRQGCISMLKYKCTEHIKEREFFSKIHAKRFEIVTYHFGASFNPRLFIKTAPVLMAPACLVGVITERGEKTIVQYRIGKPMFVILTFASMAYISFMIALIGIIAATGMGVFVDLIVSLIIIFVCIFCMVWIPKSEKEALLGFVEELGGERIG